MGFGDIMRVRTTGASQATANQDKLSYCGVAASEEMARVDLRRMKKYYDLIEKVGKKYDVNQHLIAGIISRESRAGHTLDNGWGDWDEDREAYNGFGLMQVDVNPDGGDHVPRGKWNSEAHLKQATDILVGFIRKIQRKFPHWRREKQLKGGIAAYNMGDGNVREGYDVDHFTTGQDYSNDVVARAQWYVRQRKKEDEGKQYVRQRKKEDEGKQYVRQRKKEDEDEVVAPVLVGVVVGVAVVGVAVAVALCGPPGLLALCCP